MITEITATVLAQEAQEADSIKMLSKKLDRLMYPVFINGILNIILTKCVNQVWILGNTNCID